LIATAATGLGGGGFALARSSKRTDENIDFRETALVAAFQNILNSNEEASLVGGLAR